MAVDWGKTIENAREAGYSDEEISAKLKERGVTDIPSLISKKSPVGFTDMMLSAGENFPKSAKQAVVDITAPIHSPVQTAKGIYGLARGIAEKLTPGTQEHEKYPDAIWGMMKDRYGGVDNVMQTFATDPVGVISDLSMLLSGGGAVLKGVGSATKASKLADIGRKVAQTGMAVDPINIARAGAVPLTSKISKSIPENLYNKAAKFSNAKGTPDPRKLARTALDEGLEPTFKGVDKTSRKINSYNNAIDSMIDTASKTGRPTPTRTLYKYLDGLKKEAFNWPDALGKIEDINKVKLKEMAANIAGGRQYMTPQELQLFKKNAYKGIKFDRQANKAMTMFTERSYKEIARAARERLEKLVPGIKEINEKEGALIELYDELDKAAKRIDKHNILSLRMTTAATAGGAAGGIKGLIAGLGAGLLDMPKVQYKLAKLLDTTQKTGYIPTVGTAAKRQAAFQGGRGLRELQETGVQDKPQGILQ